MAQRKVSKQDSCGGVRGIVDVRGLWGDVARGKRDLAAGLSRVAVSPERRHNQVLIHHCKRLTLEAGGYKTACNDPDNRPSNMFCSYS